MYSSAEIQKDQQFNVDASLFNELHVSHVARHFENWTPYNVSVT